MVNIVSINIFQYIFALCIYMILHCHDVIYKARCWCTRDLNFINWIDFWRPIRLFGNALAVVLEQLSKTFQTVTTHVFGLLSNDAHDKRTNYATI